MNRSGVLLSERIIWKSFGMECLSCKEVPGITLMGREGRGDRRRDIATLK